MKPRIMFVDDEKQVLEGIEANLYRRRKEWDMSFFVLPAEAVSTIVSNKYDVVVTDMRMPGMMGTTVLQKFREMSPSTVRILLSGQADTADLVKSIPNVHHYIRKPCQDGSLQAAIERSIALRDRLFDETLRAELGKQETLPADADTYWRMIRGIESDMSPEALCKTIADDPGICSKILQLANSAYFGSNEPVVSVHQAVSVLGDSWFRLMAMSSHVFIPFEAEEDLQQEALQRLKKRAVITRNLAARIVDTSMAPQASTAGLLHVIGEQWLITVHWQRYKACCLQKVAGGSLVEFLTSEFGADPGEIGAYLLALWGLPLSVVNAIKALQVPLVEAPTHPIAVNTALRVAASMTMSALSEAADWPTADVDTWLNTSGHRDVFYASLKEELTNFESAPKSQEVDVD